MHSQTAWQALMRAPWRFLSSRWPWLGLAYLLISALVGVLLLPVVVLTLVLLPLWGIAIGALERRRTQILGFPRQASGHVRVSSEQRHNWLGIRMTEAATWRAASALLVDLVAGWIALAVLFFQTIGLIGLAAVGAFASRERADITLFSGVRVDAGPDNWWLVIPIGLLMLVVCAYLNTVLAASQATLLRRLLSPRQNELARNVERLTQSRAALVHAFEAERRRIERDLHDGVQQELVTLAARLGMASLELDELAEHISRHERADDIIDPGATRKALDAAQQQAELAMTSLRSTVRGIHPAVLSDRGLQAALRELASRTHVPMVLELAELRRPSTAVETAAYFFVAEAASNAAKHATATRLEVSVRDVGELLHVRVSDNGQGGADESAGTGLRGLRERAETLRGRLTVSSPVGGPTVLQLELPRDAVLEVVGGPVPINKEVRRATAAR